MERLQKVIANKGYSSRRKAEELIEKGKVKVDGNVVTELGTKVKGNALIEVEGTVLTNENKVYYLFYKPEGVISSTKDEKGRQTILDYFHVKERIYPIGRLDYDTTGIMLLTNDGELANNMMHPKSEVDKVYIAKVEGIINGQAIRKLREGVVIEGVKTMPAKTKTKSTNRKNQTSIIEITIHEGKYHQIKKMLETVGNPVISLKRTNIAFLDLTGLRKGEYRELSFKEVKRLYSIVQKKN